MIERRTFLATGISALALTPVCGPSIAAPSPSSAARGASRRATARYVRKLARTLAHRPYRPPQEMRRGTLAALGYDGYREIRFRTEKALWRNEDLGFEI